MRAILAATRPVLHVPLGIAASIIAMVCSIAIALSQPYPTTQPRWKIVASMPKVVVASLPAKDTVAATVGLAIARHEAPEVVPPQVQPLAPKAPAQTIDAVADAKAYLAQTAYPGGSITILGRDKSIECFHPQFAVNLAATIRDAREQGFPEAAVFSGCRPPRLGIGGFSDKKNSLHGVGLAADINGIGPPCSDKAKQFHEIAASHGVFGAYGPCNRAEWNHVQGTEIKMTTPALRATFTPDGDIAPDLQEMWSAESDVVLAVATPVRSLVAGERRASNNDDDEDRPRHRRRHRHKDDDDDD